ncbi:hypothetical protein P8452_40047 [Trifolium repens]|nr:hypothetical protein P8452_40047 [Trifolium repens]
MEMEDEFLPDSVIIYIEREIADSFSLDSFVDDLESLEEGIDSQLCSSLNDYINKPLELLGKEESDGPVPLQVADDDISSRAADLSVTNLGVEATSDATVRFSVIK